MVLRLRGVGLACEIGFVLVKHFHCDWGGGVGGLSCTFLGPTLESLEMRVREGTDEPMRGVVKL